MIERTSIGGPNDLQTHGLARRARTRIYLGRPWFSSGEGERLGIVLWPPRYADLAEKHVDSDCIRVPNRSGTVNLKDFEDADLGAGGAFVTRWGGDPIRKDLRNQSGLFIPPAAFADLHPEEDNPHKPRFVGAALMPVPQASPPQASPSQSLGQNPVGKSDGHSDGASGSSADYDYLPISLLTFAPCFDPDREEWYVDVDLRPIRAAEPFVRFGLVRYQEHSVSEKLMTSEPVAVTTQLLPERDASVFELVSPSKDREFFIIVQGRGSSDIKSLSPTSLSGSVDQIRKAWQANFDMLRRPKIKLALFHETRNEWGQTMRSPINPPGLDGPNDELDWLSELKDAHIDGDVLAWTVDFRLSQSLLAELGSGSVVAYLEEVDRRMRGKLSQGTDSPGRHVRRDHLPRFGPAVQCADSFPRAIIVGYSHEEQKIYGRASSSHPTVSNRAFLGISNLIP